ncbi:MAG: YfhO family protein, partial [Candidatus Sumerlaeia bacterium]|nr:YfhO family protein [Candidatus Sumerlaeia bacterium]
MTIKTHIFCLSLLIIPVLIFYYPLLSTTSLTTGADMTALFYPARVFLTEAFRQGIIPLWNPYKFSGSPFVAPMQTAVFYPLNWLTCLVCSPICGTNFYVLLHLWLLAAFFYLLLTAGFGVHHGVAVLFSLCIPLSGCAHSQVEHLAGLGALAWTPLIILSFILALKSAQLSAVLLFLLSVSMSFLAGQPQYLSYTLLFLSGYSFFWLVATTGLIFKQRLARLCLLLLSLLFTAPLTAIQLLPALEQQKYSYRSVSGFGYAASFSMSPEFLLTFINPNFFRLPAPPDSLPLQFPEFNCYFGIVPFIFSLWAIIYFFIQRRRLEIFLSLISVFFILFALGQHLPVFKLVISAAPFLAGFRVPARIVFLVTFIWLILGARFFSLFLLHKIPPAKKTTVLILLALAIFTDLFFNSRREAFNLTAKVRFLHHTSYPWLKTIANLNVRSPLNPPSYRLFRLMNRDDDFFLSTAPSAVGQRFLRLQPDENVLFSLPLIDGYEESLLPAIRYKDFLLTYNRNLRNFAPDTLLLALLNVRYIYSELPVSSTRLHYLTTIHSNYQLFENLDWQGPAFWKDDLTKVFQLELLEGTYLRTGALQISFGTEFRSEYRKSHLTSLTEAFSHGLDCIWTSPNELRLS